MTTVRLPTELEDKLDHLAKITQRSKSFYIKEALERYLEDMEDVYVTLSRIAEPRANYLTSKELKKKLDSDDV